MKFGGSTTCSESGSVVVNVYLIAWQKQSNGSYIRLRTVEKEPAAFTPYNTGSYVAPCTAGHEVHVQYWTRVLTPSGVYISDVNTANSTPVKCGT